MKKSMVKKPYLILLLLSSGLIPPSPSSAADKMNLPPAKKAPPLITPRTTEPPPNISLPPDAFERNSFLCNRYYTYRAKLLDCDSNIEKDGEKLRPIFAPVPEAIDELNNYQRKQRHISNSAYIGSTGLGFILLSILFGTPFQGTPIITQLLPYTLSRALVFGGLCVAAGGFSYGFIQLHNNERHLNRAVDLYNQNYPKDMIRIELKAEIN